MELEYRILNLYRTRQYESCSRLCCEYLEKGRNKTIEHISMRVQTILAKVAGDGYEEVGYGGSESELVTTAVAKTPRPGTTFQRTTAKSSGMTMNRATTARRVTSTGTGRTRSAISALNSAARASRAATAFASNGTYAPGQPVPITLNTLEDKLFQASAKTLFEYVLYCEGDVRKALELCVQAQKKDTSPDWWWDFASAKCYLNLGMHRAAEESLRKALKKNKHIATYLRLIALFVDLNQPISALEVCKQGLAVFPEDIALLTEQARIHEEMGNEALAVQDYRRVALEDPMNMEAIASIAMNNFYNDQPEIALRYYRRLLATCPAGAEIYNNLGLCCLYCNQWDLILPCFRQAIFFATNDQIRADIWFNLAHVAISTGDLVLARRCLQLSLAMSSEHAGAKSALRSIENRARVKKNKQKIDDAVV